MTITVKDFLWRQTEETVILNVPLHGRTQSEVDVIITEEYVKASFGPFYFECFPIAAVNVEESKSLVKSKEVVFSLVKNIACLWETLEKVLTKPEKKAIKLEAVESRQKRLSEKKSAIAETRCNLQREAVRFSIAADTKQRNLIADLKEAEKNNALGDFQEWSSQLNQNEGKLKTKERTKEKPKEKQVRKTATDFVTIPLPRNRGCDVNETEIGVVFTPRVFPTPSRESYSSEEVEWLTKQAEARRSVGFVAEDLRPEEKSPIEMMSKGKLFMTHGNYLGAISALSFGIKLSPNYVDLHILRSEAHFAQGNFHKCAIDCSTALELLKPECNVNLKQRVESIHRRGKALFRLGLRQQAMSELEAAWKLQPSDALMKDLREVSQAGEIVENAVPGLKETDFTDLIQKTE